jgi:hypothetical protein
MSNLHIGKLDNIEERNKPDHDNLLHICVKNMNII